MADYVPHDGPLDDICFPALAPERVRDEAAFVWNSGLLGPVAGR